MQGFVCDMGLLNINPGNRKNKEILTHYKRCSLCCLPQLQGKSPFFRAIWLPTASVFSIFLCHLPLSLETFDCFPHPPFYHLVSSSTLSTTITLGSGIFCISGNRILVCHHQVPVVTTWREPPCQKLGDITLTMRRCRLACYK